MSSISAEFKALMQQIAEGWQEGDATKAASCFAENASYVEPPDKQVYQGRAELYEFFGGDAGLDRPMFMTWHNLAFDEATQTGFGEYTFQMNSRYHGIVVVTLKDGLIQTWREYQYKSDLEWPTFTNANSS